MRNEVGEDRDDEGEADWPVEIEDLVKGDSIGSDILAPWFDAEFGSQVYQLKLAVFTRELETALWALGRRWVVRCSQGHAAILTDAEAAVYTRDRFDANYRGLHRTNRRARAVDQRELDHDERRRHEHTLLVQGAMITSASEARELVQPTVYRRRNPGAEAFARDAP